MKPLFKNNQEELDSYLPLVKESINEWQLITIAITPECILPYDELIAKLMDVYNGQPGVVFNAGYFRVYMLVRSSKIHNYALAKKELQQQLPQDFCFLNFSAVTLEVLDYLRDIYMKPENSFIDDYGILEQETKTKILVADDDTMVTRVMRKILEEYAEVQDVQKGCDVLETYKSYLPDVVFLDIHMPGVNGLENLTKILDYNPCAYVVVFSSDSVASKILEASERGASGFVGKPIQRGRVLDYLKMCPTSRFEGERF